MSNVMNERIDLRADLSAVVIRRDGSREDLGIVSRSSRAFRDLVLRLRKTFRKMANAFGLLLAAALMMGLVHSGELPFVALPMMGLVTTAGVNYMASDFASGGVTPTISGCKFHDSGTGSTAAAIGDTVLQTPTGNARVSGVATNPSANIYQSVATLPYTVSQAITEWGIFSAAAAGTLWDHRVFLAINVNNGDSISFTYKLTIPAGGS